MRVVLVNPRGFCAGVTMAVKCLDLVLRELEGPVYVYHEIVHNRHVVEEFELRGAVFVDDVAEVPSGSVLVFSAHGVSPAVRQLAKARRLQTIDATCPLVTKVHTEAIRFAREGYTILLIGHAGHDEVVGIVGEAPDSIILVTSLDDIQRLSFPRDTKLAWLTQTTLSVDESSRIVTMLQRRFPWIVGPAKDDICFATQHRQQALRESCQQADVVVVVGSQNSSNSRRLVELAVKRGIRAHFVNDQSQLVADWFCTAQTVVVTAGASAPENAVQEIVDWLVDRFDVQIEERKGVIEDQVFPLPSEIRHGFAKVRSTARREALA
jgi:4-hydroxy-3-methylbut-2-enyl diphosphate reductase